MKLDFISAGSWKWGAPLVLILMFVFLNPVGYVGGGADDARYVEAAKCWLAHGPCLPQNHWDGRWPVIAPLAAAIGVLGTDRLAIGIGSVVASAACLALLKLLGDQLFGRPVGLASALIFGLLPVFATQAFSANVEPFELLFILAGFALLRSHAILAGLAFALAFQTRETSIVALLPAILLLRKEPQRMLAFGLAFVAPLLAEMLFFTLTTGEPLYRRTHSIEHVLIPSDQLRSFDGGWPFFNRSLIANWAHEPGIEIHWLIDGFANLFINLRTGWLFMLTPLFFLLYRARLAPLERSATGCLIGGAFLYSAALIYGLSIDPKPRMMYVPLAALSLALAVVAVRAWNAVIAATFAVMVPLMALNLAAQPRLLHWERAAERFRQQYPGTMETTRQFELSPKLSGLRPVGAGGTYLLVLKDKPCEEQSQLDPFDPATLQLVDRQANHPAAVLLGDRWTLCLFRYPSR